MKKISHGNVLFAVLLILAWGSANATCELVPLKQQNFGGLELIRACSILPFLALQPDGPDICAGLPVTAPQEPVVNLVANDMLYFNWEIPAARVPALEAALQLGDRGFHIAPIEIISDEDPKYYMSLNFYRTVIAGVINYRSEWSIYVAKDGDSKPRYMVIDVQSSEDSADPTYPGFIKPASPVSYSIDGEEVEVSSEDFLASFILPGAGTEKIVDVGKQWAEANDALYWINGLADTALYNGTLTDAALISIDPDSVVIHNSSAWSAFIPARPENIVMFSQPLEFAFTPYFNLGDPTLGLDPAYKAGLQAFKDFTFGAFSYGHAFLVLQGLEEPLLPFNVIDDEVPSLFVNFEIPQRNVKAFASALHLPPGFKLARSKMTPAQPARYLLTLNIYQTPDVLTGAPVYRAEWSTYVKDTRDLSGDRYYLMVIDVESSGASLNPVDLFTPPAPVFTYKVHDGQIEADIKSIAGGAVVNKFAIEFDLPAQDAGDVRLHEPWVLANDRVYWLNGVYDELFYNGLLLDANVAEVDLSTVAITDSTRWAQYVNPMPTQVLVFRNPLEFVLHPWKNVEERCGVPASRTSVLQ
jgi:hypothetical protein